MGGEEELVIELELDIKDVDLAVWALGVEGVCVGDVGALEARWYGRELEGGGEVHEEGGQDLEVIDIDLAVGDIRGLEGFGGDVCVTEAGLVAGDAKGHGKVGLHHLALVIDDAAAVCVGGEGSGGGRAKIDSY